MNSFEQTKPNKKKILVIDDDRDFLELMEMSLHLYGYEPVTAVNGLNGLDKLVLHNPDLVILDIFMPKLDGFETCKRIRAISDVPIIILTAARTAKKDFVNGLDSGADAYLHKPLDYLQLFAIARALFRRMENTPVVLYEPYEDGILSIDMIRRRVTRHGKEIDLTPKEFHLLKEIFETRPGVATFSTLLKNVWDIHDDNDKYKVRDTIRRLRQKIEPDHQHPIYILNVMGIGYRFADQMQRTHSSD